MKKGNILGILLLIVTAFCFDSYSQNTCASPTNITALPFTANGQTTCNRGADYSSGACLNPSTTNATDIVYAFTPAQNTCITINLSNVMYGGASPPDNVGLYLLNGCPTSAGVQCVQSSTSNYNQASVVPPVISNAVLMAGITYYIIIDVGDASDISSCINFNITVTSEPCPKPPPPPLPTAPQGVECGNNLGFESGNLSSWTGCYYGGGSPACCPLKCDVQGVKPGVNSVNGGLGGCTSNPGGNNNIRHTVTTGNGIDPNSDGNIPVVAPGGRKFSVRIGNHEAGYQAECLSQTFPVTKANALLTYLYAVVLQDPSGHADDERPRFEIKITDKNGISPACGGLYTVISKNAAAEGFENAQNPQCGSSDVWYKRWTAVATDLTAYINQSVTIRFCTADCGQGGHYGYAYVDTYCSPLEILGSTVCTTGGAVTLTSPSGFSGYSWYNGGQPVNGGVIANTHTVSVPGTTGAIFTVKMANIASPGCFTYITDTVLVFSASASGDTAICDTAKGPIILRTTNTDPSNTSYKWSPSTNLTCTTCPNPTVSPPYTNRTYTVTMVNVAGCTVTDAVKVTVQPCFISVVAPPAILCEGACVSLTATASGGTAPYTYSWSPGAFVGNPLNICPSATTTYTVTAHDATGLSAITKAIVTVLPNPIITSVSQSICAGNCTSLTANGAGTGGTYTWIPNIGSGSGPFILCPSVTSSYTVIGATSFGCTGSATAAITVYPPATAAFTANRVCKGVPTVFTDQSTVGAGGVISTWTWNFGDPGSGTNNTSHIQHPTHLYSAAGTFTVRLSVTTSFGCLATHTATVIVDPIPVADFNFTEPCFTIATQFTDKSIVPPPGGSITSWNWTFGEPGSSGNNISALQNPTHTYLSPGSYTVTLIVKNAGGCIDTIQKAVNVWAIPVPKFGPPAKGCKPVCVNFWDSSRVAPPSIINKWSWDFGDPGSGAGNTSGSYSPAHCYEKEGVYSVQMTVTSDHGCSATLRRDTIIRVFPTPNADFTASPQPTTIWEPKIYFKDISTGEPVKWFWTFEEADCQNDSLTDSIQHPVHTYCDTGTYQVCLNIVNKYGCPSSICKFIVISPEWTFFIPNAFSPNKDGKNDFFIGKSWNVIEHQMWIYDRWGNMIYTTGQSKDPESAVPWDGRASYGSDPAQEDVYLWVVMLKDIFGKPHKYVGHVSLVK